MKHYLLPEQGTFYKANLHCHSTISDGRKTVEELKEFYKSHGYSVLAYTDHDVFLHHHDLTDDQFLALGGFEVECNEPFKVRDRKTTHLCFIAKSPDVVIQPCWNERYCDIPHGGNYKHLVQFDPSLPPFERSHTPECVNAMIKAGREGGFFVTYNLPTWSQEHYEDYSKYEGMHAMEIYNNDCHGIGYESYVPGIYDDMLLGGQKIFALATDDNHNKFPDDSPRCDSFGGFVMIKAEKLEYETITKALFDGNFYASQGPEIYDLYVEDEKIYVTCSDAAVISLNSGRRSAQVAHAPVGESIREAVFELRRDDPYFRITVTDKYGKHANTRAYFPEHLDV